MPKRGQLRIGLVQMGATPDVHDNLSQAVTRVEEAATRGAGIICLQELFRTTYFCQQQDASLFELAERVPGPSTEALARVARDRGVVVIAPIFERRAHGLYHNSAAVIDADGSLVGLYRKMHIPDDPGYYEKYYFTPGDLGFRVFDTAVGRIAVLICWDQWFPESARLATLAGATVIFFPTAIGWHPDEKERYGSIQREAWRTVQRGHAIANNVYVAAVNRVGHELPREGGKGIEFWGSSFVADPQGVMLAEASIEREEILTADVDCAHLENVRRHWPFLRDRRVDAYAGLAKRFLDEDASQ